MMKLQPVWEAIFIKSLQKLEFFCFGLSIAFKKAKKGGLFIDKPEFQVLSIPPNIHYDLRAYPVIFLYTFFSLLLIGKSSFRQIALFFIMYFD